MHNANVPEALHGWSLLHRIYAFDRRRWARLGAAQRATISTAAQAAFTRFETDGERDLALIQVLGGKGDLMLLHYGRDFEVLGQTEVIVDGLEISDYLQPRSSYVSVLEVGRHEATARIHEELRSRGVETHSSDWQRAFDRAIAEEEISISQRLWAKIPRRRYMCFYPMNKRRGETWNWYALPFEERRRLMREHGAGGRTFHGLATQVISGSIGFDDWEWGVDLFADDPLILKRLIYELRFDEVSSHYAEFGPSVTGLRFSVDRLPAFLSGIEVPQLLTERRTTATALIEA